MDARVFSGVIPALMTPCGPDRRPDTATLVRKARSLIASGMSAVVYCGSMGDWPLLSDADRMAGVEALCGAGVPAIVGTGAVNTASAVAHAAHAARVGAKGLMVIPRVLSRGTSPAAQRAHFEAILGAAPNLPAIIYNSPYYGFATRADLFFALREAHPNLVGFKEFGGAADLRCAAEHITSRDPGVALVVGVDTEVVHGIVNCGASGVISGIGNVLPNEVLHLHNLAVAAARGGAEARARARELDEALHVLSTFDEGPDLVLYFKHLLTLRGEAGFAHQLNPTDALSASQAAYATAQLRLFEAWYAEWSRLPGAVRECLPQRPAAATAAE